MAELTKKLQVKVSGTTTPCKIYSTAAEAGTSYVRAKVDNVEAYIPLVDASDDRASKVRVGSKYIAKNAKPVYTEKAWTTAGTYTFTIPSGVERIRAAVCGGGGGSFYKNGDEPSSKSPYNGGTSSITVDNSVLIKAGGGTLYLYAYDESYYQQLGVGGSPNGKRPSNGRNQAVGWQLNFSKVDGNYGSSATGAGSGGYDTNYFNVSPGKTLKITVGKKGDIVGGSDHQNTDGFVLIAYGGNI